MSQICDIENGNCASLGEIAYVDNGGNAATCIGPGDGSSAHPFCTIQSAIGSGRHYIAIKGYNWGSTPSKAYGPIVVTKQTISLIGLSQDQSAPTTIYSSNANAITLTTSGTDSASVTLDRIEIGDRAIDTATPAITCSNTGNSAKLIARRSTIQHSSVGIAATSCDIALDQTTVTQNATQGLSLTASTLKMKNSIVAVNGSEGLSLVSGCNVTMDEDTIGPRNGGGGIKLENAIGFNITNTVVYQNGSAMAPLGGISITGSSPMTTSLVNLTVTENSSNPNSVSGISCLPNTILFNTAVVGNVGGNMELASECATNSDAYKNASGPNLELGSCSDMDLFVDAGSANFLPQKVSQMTCSVTLVNKGVLSFMGIAAPDHDRNGAPRPQTAGAKPTIGAYEALP